MSDAGRVDSTAALPSILKHAHIGPIIPGHATVTRYAAALGVVFAIFALRAALAPLLGVQAPLLPFLLGVLLSAYLGGRGPALLASLVAPLLATLWFTSWPSGAPPWQWVAHVLFFLILAVTTTYTVLALQLTVRAAQEDRQRAEDSAAALREADRRKDEFLAMLAHELRNPLTPVRNVAHILSREAPDPDPGTVRRAGEMLERQANHLTRLVDDLLDVARITHRRIQLRPEILALEDVVATALEAVRAELQARHQLVTTTVTTANVHVRGDVVRLCQVISNLLTNASKYSPEGSRIHINVGADDQHATLSVRDEGMGLDPQLLPRLFDLFMQGDRSLDRAEGGLGIGLTIVKHLTEMHGGSVEVASGGLNQGSEFRIRLPRAHELPAEVSAIHNPDARVRRRRVLVVDDDVDCAESLRDLLRLEGHRVMLARDGTTALSALDEFPADIVLLDVALPRMDGYMVAHAIRARFGPRPHPRLIALTGYGRAEDRQAAMRSGFDDHLTKPVEPARLLRVIDEGVPTVAREGTS